MAERTNRAFPDELPQLLHEQGLSLRRLARQVGVTDAHLSRVTRRANYKTVSGELAERVAAALGLPADYFPEAREAYVLQHVRRDPRLRDRLFDQLMAEDTNA